MSSAGTKYEDIVKTYYWIERIEGQTVYSCVYFPESNHISSLYEVFCSRYGFHTYDQDKVKVGAFFVNTNCREISPSGRVLRISYNDILTEEELREVQNRKPNGD